MSKSKILKHLSDLITPKTANQKATENITKGQRTYREGQRKSGAAGVVAGAGAVAAMSDNGDKKVVKEAKAKGTASKDTRANPKDYPTYKKDTPSSKAFKDAFAKAKDGGKKSFTFEGRSYKVEEKKEPKKMMKGGYSTKGKK